jgi:peptide/nickel transport system substrate-binding protein
MRKRNEVNMKRWIWVCGLYLVAVLTTPIMAFGQEIPVRGGTLIWARAGDNVRLDLAQVTDADSIKTCIQIMETLVQFDPNSFELKPCLATSWKVSDDGLTWTFRLRKGVKFHDGTKFTAQAVKDSLERVINKDHPFYKYGKWAFAKDILATVEEVKVIDDYTAAIVTRYPFAALPTNLARSGLCNILSPKAMAELKDRVHLKPVGTGPFMFVRWDRGDQTIVERNDNWWGSPQPYLDKIVMKVMPEPSARRMALQSGAVDLADDLDPDSISLVKKDPNITVIVRPGACINYIALNCERPNLDNPLVRQAINHAINREELVKTIFLGMATPEKSCIAPVNYGYMVTSTT